VRRERLSSRSAEEVAQELADGNHFDPMTLDHRDQIRVALQVIISGHEVARPAADGRLQDLVVIGIAAHPQLAQD
jgi:hypothetical protein